jgi:hypothetical protein
MSGGVVECTFVAAGIEVRKIFVVSCRPSVWIPVFMLGPVVAGSVDRIVGMSGSEFEVLLWIGMGRAG